MDIYEKLREHLDKHPIGAPPAPELIEIFKLLFTEEEAEVALGTAYVPKTAEEIATRAGVEIGAARESLESLADKGLAYAREKEGSWGYALLPIMPGIYEFPYMKGEKNELLDKLSGLWHSYHAKFLDKLGSPDVHFARVIPIEEEIPGETKVLPYERLYEMIDNAKVLGIAHCACRESEGNCDAPRETCMLFDDTCAYLVDRGFARYVTKEEMKQKLRDFDEAGLVHMVNNSQDKLTFVCNCCTCCCGILRSLLQYDNPNAFTTSGFLAFADPDLCDGCGICVDDRCPMEAIDLTDEIAVVNKDRCMGCGLCVTGCPSEALRLVRREEVPVPIPTLRELGMRWLDERGKLEEFLEVNYGK